MTREEWLNLAALKLGPLFKQHELELPRVKISCGWPTKNPLGSRSRTVGQCFSKACSGSGINEIFISPVLSKSEDVLACLVHELIHASDDNKSKHGPAFVKKARTLGLEGKATATVAGEALKVHFREMVLFNGLGEYPHEILDVSKGIKKQTTRLLKAKCPVCDYTIRVTSKWAEQGLPTCPNDETEFQLAQ